MDDDRAAASWAPACEFQLANWTPEEPAAASDVWAPAGLPDPVEQYWPIDIFDSCSIQACVPGSRGAEQLVERYYYYSAAAASQHQHDGPSENPAEAVIDVQNRLEVKENSSKQSGGTTKVIVTNDSGIDARGVIERVRREFKDDMGLIQEKVHRYPAVLGALDESYTVPRVVAIGPYHHDKPHLMKVEKVKHMAATQCVKESGCSLEEVFAKVVSVSGEEAWSLYDKDTMTEKGIRYGDDFWHMMFFDACFLVQYILSQTGLSKLVDQSLRDFFGPNRMDIFQDITMFENQLPWNVLQTVLEFLPVRYNPIKELIRRYEGYLQDQLESTEDGNAPTSTLTFDEDYSPPHLLGLLRHHTVGKLSDDEDEVNTTKDTGTPLISISAMELAEIGITLRANMASRELVHMGLRQEGAFGAELLLVPLSLDHNRASYLVNMAAFELCTVRSFQNDPFRDSAVCSYLQLLAMLVHREEDVQELRATGVLQGGGGLTNQQVLSFFTSFQGQRRGKLYLRIMRDIEEYKDNRRLWIKFYSFFYKNWGVLSAVVSSILTLMSLR